MLLQSLYCNASWEYNPDQCCLLTNNHICEITELHIHCVRSTGSTYRQGLYIKFEILFFAPPPLRDSYFFPKWNVLYWGEAGKKFAGFFVAILFLSQLRKKYAYFLPIGEKNMHFNSTAFFIFIYFI